MNILAMLQFAIAVGLVLLIAMWGLYVWMKRTGRLTKSRVVDELLEQAVRNQGYKNLDDFIERAGKRRS